MKPILLLAAALLLAACSNPRKTAQPVIDWYLMGHVSHPEAYRAVRLEYLGAARVDNDFYRGDIEGPCGDSTDVRVFAQTFRHLDRSGVPAENTFCLYLNEDLTAVLTSHPGAEPREDELVWRR